MARRKWTLVIFLVFVCPYVCSRPSQETLPSPVVPSSETTEIPNRSSTEKSTEAAVLLSSNVTQTNSPRDVKTKVPQLGDSIKMVANQLLQNLQNSSESSVVTDTRIPPKVKTQLTQKLSTKTRQDDAEPKVENSHAGVAVPVSLEELESENKISDTTNESSTSNEGISTWILLSNPTNKDLISSTEATKPEESTKKAKPVSKNKTKRPQQNNNKNKRPIIGSTNKSDLIAGGSAINENVFNKIKATVLSNVQKNKNALMNKSTTTATTSTTTEATTSAPTTRKEVSTKPPSTVSVAKVSKPLKKKNKNKLKSTTTLAPTISDSALLPMEPKEQEIELEISTPATTTKKPKRSSTKKKKKNKTKKKKTKPPVDSAVSETKVTNKTKSVKPASKKPAAAKNPISTQIYNYLSREVMPSVGVGIVGLAGLVGLAGYFLYPFSTPVRRTFEVDKKDDLYRHNAEEYANEGNGQAEEEMLGTVLAGMPAHEKNKFNPYVAQTNNRYPAKKEKDNQNIRYRQGAATSSYESPNYNTHYPQNYQQKTGLAHGAVYSRPVNYNTQYETRHAYTTENKYPYEAKNAYPYPAVEPIYAAPQTGPAVVSSYGNDASSSVVYGVKPTQDTEFKPVYPYEGQVYSETTSQPAMSYPSTSMYLGSNNESENLEETEVNYDENENSEVADKFVVGNVPKEFSDNVTPAIVPEHGPRKLARRKRSTIQRKRSIVGSIEDIIKAAKSGKHDELSNEIDAALGVAKGNEITDAASTVATKNEPESNMKTEDSEKATIYPVYAVSIDGQKTDSESIFKDGIVESISTLPIQPESESKPTTESEMSNELDGTTKPFKVYEIFTTGNPAVTNEEQKEFVTEMIETTTETKKNTETTTDSKIEVSTIAATASPVEETKGPTEPTFTTPNQVKPTFNPNVITYPPYNEEGSFFTFIKRLLEFKYRLGLSILQTTSESLNRYLRSMESSVQNMAKGSKY